MERLSWSRAGYRSRRGSAGRNRTYRCQPIRKRRQHRRQRQAVAMKPQSRQCRNRQRRRRARRSRDRNVPRPGILNWLLPLEARLTQSTNRRVTRQRHLMPMQCRRPIVPRHRQNRRRLQRIARRGLPWVRLASRRFIPVGRMRRRHLRRPWKCLYTAPLPPRRSLRWTDLAAMRRQCGSLAGSDPAQGHQ